MIFRWRAQSRVKIIKWKRLAFILGFLAGMVFLLPVGYASAISEGDPIRAEDILDLRSRVIAKASACSVSHSMALNPDGEIGVDQTIRFSHVQQAQVLARDIYLKKEKTVPWAAAQDQWVAQGQVISAAVIRDLLAAIEAIDFCSAGVQGVCGASSGGSFVSAPLPAPCASGTMDHFILSGDRWTWNCMGSDGGSDALDCFATRSAPSPGLCGDAQNRDFALPPAVGLCQSGNPSEVLPSEFGRWLWTCENPPGEAASCSAGILTGCATAKDCIQPPKCKTAMNATCVEGLCVYPDRVCQAPSNCYSSVCRPESGVCDDVVKVGEPCDDENEATGPDTCQASGVCWGPDISCRKASDCVFKMCQTASCVSGGCVYEAVPDGAHISCGNTNPCDGNEFCRRGICVSGSVPHCDDSNFCTQDYCQTDFGCRNVSAPIAGTWSSWSSCSDGLQTRRCEGALCEGLCAPDADGSRTSKPCPGECQSDADCVKPPICRTAVGAHCDRSKICQYPTAPDGTGCGEGKSCQDGSCRSLYWRITSTADYLSGFGHSPLCGARLTALGWSIGDKPCVAPRNSAIYCESSTKDPMSGWTFNFSTRYQCSD